MVPNNTIPKQTTMMLYNLKAQIVHFPSESGVYIMRDINKNYLYIGKAKNLKNRIRSYFLDKHDNRHQVPFLMRKVDSIDWIATTTETEALILEANLIRSHKPPYNIDLKDDKHYPYLKITLMERFPRLIVTRKIIKDGACYLGPYTDVAAMRKTKTFVTRIFKLRTCNKKLPLKIAVRPCINFSMAHCDGACGAKISEKIYKKNIDLCIRFLRGEQKNIIKKLNEEMEKSSAKLEFETAAKFRDQINAIKRSLHNQRVDLIMPDGKLDVFGFYTSDTHITVSVLSFREGILLDKANYMINRKNWDIPFADKETVVLQYYQQCLKSLPTILLLPNIKEFQTTLIEQWFLAEHKHNIKVTIPKQGTKKKLVSMATKNAHLYSKQKMQSNPDIYLNTLQKECALSKKPTIIEAFDISNIGDKFTVAAMVQFANGSPKRDQYRNYRIKSVDGQNDFAMMMEVVSRRLLYLVAEKKAFPDLILIDGGKGQLSSAIKALNSFSNPPMIISIAKKEEIIFSPYLSNPIRLSQHHPVRRFIERMRNEVHRRAIAYHRKLRGTEFKSTSLESLSGIGKYKAEKLLRHFGSLKRVKMASFKDIAVIEGFSEKLAKKIVEQLS